MSNKYTDIDQAIADLVQAKRRAQSDGMSAERTLERAAQYRLDAARLVAQAEEMEANAKGWKARYVALDRQVDALRAERVALRERERFARAESALALLSSLDPEMVAKLLAESPELAPIVDAMRQTEGGDACGS